MGKKGKKKNKGKNKQQQNQQNQQNKRADREWKKTNRKKRGKQAQYKHQLLLYNEQLAQLQLSIREVSGDGNCLFRAISDQLTSNEKYHYNIRDILCNDIPLILMIV